MSAMTTETLEQHMDTVRASRPHSSKWQDPGEGHIDRTIWRNPDEAAARWLTSANTVRKYAPRIPHIVTLGRFRYFHIDLIEAIRAELLKGKTFDQALQVLEIEPTDIQDKKDITP